LQYKDQELNLAGALSPANGAGFEQPEVSSSADD